MALQLVQRILQGLTCFILHLAFSASAKVHREMVLISNRIPPSSIKTAGKKIGYWPLASKYSEYSRGASSSIIRTIIFVFTCLITSLVNAQMTIGPNSTMIIQADSFAIRGNLVNNSPQTNLGNAQLTLTGTTQAITTATPMAVKGIIVKGGGNKAIRGDWTVTQNLLFDQGVLASDNGKLVYTGSTLLEGKPNSFFNGILYQRGTGTRFFPVGAGNVYAPMAFGSVLQANVEIGVQAFSSNPGFDLPPDVAAVASNRYWAISTSGGAFSGSGVSLYYPGSSVDAAQRLTVVESETLGGTATNLGGGVTEDFVVSLQPATKPFLSLGVAETVDIRISDLITPFNVDDINDKLKIINIQYTVENTVTIIDRWGVPVKTWKNFTNYDDPINPNTDNFDFTRLSQGNYICVLEYKLTADGPKQNMTQMISVLKSN
jgi:hypothetical protein